MKPRGKKGPADPQPEEELKDSPELNQTDMNSGGTDTENSPEEVTPAVNGNEAEEQPADDRDRKLADLSDKYIRLMAEYDNFRKRSRQEKDQLYEQSITDVVKEWLPVVDNLERAISATEAAKTDEAVKILEGLNLVMRQVEKTLENLKVKTIYPLNETFNPNTHSAVLHIEDEQFGSSEIVEVFEKGYERDGKVIRHAVVKVAN